MLYAYGMMLRGRQPLGQPNDYVDYQDFDRRCKLPSGDEVWSIIWYERELTGKEIYAYELVRLEDEDK